MALSKQRRFWLMVSVVSLGVFALSAWRMAERVQNFHARRAKELFVFKPDSRREFMFADRLVTLADLPAEEGRSSVKLTYGTQEQVLSTTLKVGSEQLPGLLRHDDWLRVLNFAPITGKNIEELAESLKRGEGRVAVVTRRPLLGANPTSGTYSKRDWAFDFHELKRDGTIAHESWLFPKNRAGRDRKPTELPEGSWQESAAMHLMPSFAAPNSTFGSDAVRAMGWTLPVAGISMLSLTFGLALAIGPRVTRDKGGLVPPAVPTA